MDRGEHWGNVYRTKKSNEVSWYQPDPKISMKLLQSVSTHDSRIIDVGGGASFLVDRLLDAGFKNVCVLDISAAALERAKARLRENADRVQWIVADVTDVQSMGSFNVWHDRALFHFLTVADDRRKYVDLAMRTIPPGGHLVIGSFARDGPLRCSGLDVRRYDAESLGAEFGSTFTLVHQEREIHITPWGKPQAFLFAVLSRQ